MRDGDGEDRERISPELTGTVVRFNEVRGFGWIKPDEPGPDLFVHWSRIMGEGYRLLEAGQRVRFLKSPGRKDGQGPQATRVYVEPATPDAAA